MSDDMIAFLKGRMAEVLVERIFVNSEYHVRNFGAPWKFLTLPMLRGEEKSPAPTRSGRFSVRTDEPDFVIFPKYTLQPKEFIEVKFRMAVGLKNDLDGGIKEGCQFWTKEVPEVPLSVIVVNCNIQPYFQVLRSPYVDARSNFLPLKPMTEAGWKIEPSVYSQAEDLISKGVFDGVCL